MQTLFVEQKIDYTGVQLRPHYLYNNFGLKGNALVSFTGRADVSLENMVDQEDVCNRQAIFSENMLHFIAEFFENDLLTAVYRQRLYMSIIQEHLPAGFVRQGDDLYKNDQKFSVSIATASSVSTLIHIGLNISSKNTPVKTIGLNDIGVEPADFARKILQAVQEEEAQIYHARCKVRGV